MKKIDVKIKRLSDKFSDIDLPSYSTNGSAGMDVRAAVADSLIVKPMEVVLVPTDFSVEIPEGYEIQVRPRSGLAIKHSIAILNSPGTIDSDYRGEVKIILMNFGKENFVINRGDRIAQLVLAAVIQANLIETNNLKESMRGEGGFGHTGRN